MVGGCGPKVFREKTNAGAHEFRYTSRSRSMFKDALRRKEYQSYHNIKTHRRRKFRDWSSTTSLRLFALPAFRAYTVRSTRPFDNFWRRSALLCVPKIWFRTISQLNRVFDRWKETRTHLGFFFTSTAFGWYQFFFFEIHDVTLTADEGVSYVTSIVRIQGSRLRRSRSARITLNNYYNNTWCATSGIQNPRIRGECGQHELICKTKNRKTAFSLNKQVRSMNDWDIIDIILCPEVIVHIQFIDTKTIIL